MLQTGDLVPATLILPGGGAQALSSNNVSFQVTGTAARMDLQGLLGAASDGAISGVTLIQEASLSFYSVSSLGGPNIAMSLGGGREISTAVITDHLALRLSVNDTVVGNITGTDVHGRAGGTVTPDYLPLLPLQ